MSRMNADAKKMRQAYNESQEIESLQRVFERLDKNGDKKVDVDELFDCIKYLGYNCTKKEVADMIWEVRAHELASPNRAAAAMSKKALAPQLSPTTLISFAAASQVDEDCDKMLSWDEFKLMCARHPSGPEPGTPTRPSSHALAPRPWLRLHLRRYQRVRGDKSGWEPKRLFTMVEFMMHDKDASGTIDADECMEILYQRFGAGQVDGKVKEFMMQDVDGENDVTFAEYLNMEKRIQERQMRSHPAFRYSQGLVDDTKTETRRLLASARPGHS